MGLFKYASKECNINHFIHNTMYSLEYEEINLKLTIQGIESLLINE